MRSTLWLGNGVHGKLSVEETGVWHNPGSPRPKHTARGIESIRFDSGKVLRVPARRTPDIPNSRHVGFGLGQPPRRLNTYSSTEDCASPIVPRVACCARNPGLRFANAFGVEDLAGHRLFKVASFN